MTTTILTTSISPISIQANDPMKLVEYLMNDLRALSTEARKKHNHIKEAAESGLVKVRNISTGSGDNLLQTMRSASTEIIHPFLLGCSSKSSRMVQISLQSIQRLLQFKAVNVNAVPGIVNEIWQLTEAECEELKVLQTITQFVSTELLVTDWALAKCIVLAFRLNFSKDSSVINAASAAVRQLFNCVFERVIQEDGIRGEAELRILPQQMTNSSRQTMAPPTLRPAAADAFLLLRDICTLIRKEPPNWLIGIQKITPILALELLEAVVKSYPSIFFKHSEFAEILKTQVCDQIIKMIIGEKELAVLTNANGNVQQQQNHLMPVSATLLGQHFLQSQSSPIVTTRARDFPIMIRALRICMALISHYHILLGHPQCEVIIHFLLDLLQHSTTSWESAVSIEVLHKLMAQPTLLRFFCDNQDEPKFIELIFSQLTIFVKKCLEEAAIDGQSMREENFAHPGFVYKGVFLPLSETQIAAKRSILLDWLDKHNAEKIPEAYCLSIGFATLIDSTHSTYSAIEGEHSPFQQTRKILVDEKLQQQNQTKPKQLEYSDRARELYLSSYGPLILGLSTLLEFSMDDSLSEQLLNCLSSLTTLACRIGLSEAKHTTLKTICRAALPTNYYSKYIESSTNANAANNNIHQQSNGSLMSGRSAASSSIGGKVIGGSDSTPNIAMPSVEPTQVVAMGTVCSSPHLPSNLFNTPVMLTAKNLQVARLLINCAHSNGQFLGDNWEMALTTIQHFVWIIGLRPTSTGSFRAGRETIPSSEGSAGGAGISTTSGASSSGAINVILTTAASSELPDLNQQLNALFESTTQLDEVSLHHVIAAFCKLSNESMIVAQMSSRETSFFSIAKLLQCSLANLDRLQIFWRPVTAHLLELCGHSNANIREWGALSLTQLVKNAMKQAITLQNVDQNELAKREQLILNSLSAMNEIDLLDIRSKQLDCLMRILQTGARPFEPQLWPMIIQIVSAIVETEGRITDSSLIDQGFRALSIIVKEFLGTLPFDCVELLIETDAHFGQQQHHLNVSLASIGQLWDISDFVRRETNQSVTKQQREEAEKVWLVIYRALGHLCVDPRSPVRKSACDTLLQTVAAHGQALGTQCWTKMVKEILFPMLDRVRLITQTASTQKSRTTSLGAPNLMIHHSRDTESKQWTETSVKILGGVVKIFNAQRPVLLLLENFSDYWSQLLKHIELAAQTNNSEMSLAALKNFQELLFGRPQQTEQNISSLGMGRGGEKQLTGAKIEPDLSLAPSLPEPLWMASWSAWFSVAKAIISIECPSTSSFDPNLIVVDNSQTTFMPTIQKLYIPGLYHLSTLLEIFLWLFHRVRHHVPVEDLCQNRIGNIFLEIAAVPVSIDPISMAISNQGTEQPLNTAQELLFTSIRVILQEQIDPVGCKHLREALPNMLRLLLLFVQFAWKSPKNKFAFLKPTENLSVDQNTTPSKNLINFGETSLKILLEFYTKTANFEEIIQHTILVDIIKKLAEPMALKYGCPSQSTWQLAATTFNKICQIGLPIARENVNLFKQLWPTFAAAVEGFLFSSSKVHCPLNSDERKRHEFMDCLVVELIRTELLPFANKLPRDFIQQQIIQILNRGSINTMDANDVLALDVHQQRTDLSRVCFDALLSLTQMESPSAQHQQLTKFGNIEGGLLRNTSPSAVCTSLGATAIASLLNRCKQVLNDFARDEQNSGHLRLPQERIFETISALRAVTALIEGFSNNPNSTLYSHLVTMHPALVQLIPSSRGDQQVELALMACLNSYRTLLLLNLHNHNQ